MKRIAVAPYLALSQAWWDDHSERDRRLLATVGAVAALALLVVLVIRPLQTARAKALADIRTYETLSAGIRAAGPDLGRRTALGGGSLPTVITGSAATAGLTIQRLEPEGSRTRVVIEDASYDAVVAWLAELERSGGVHIAEVKLDRRPTSGMVGAQLLLAR